MTISPLDHTTLLRPAHNHDHPHNENVFAVRPTLTGNFFIGSNFYWPQTKTSYKRQFSPKSPKVDQKSGQSVQTERDGNSNVLPLS